MKQTAKNRTHKELAGASERPEFKSSIWSACTATGLESNIGRGAGAECSLIYQSRGEPVNVLSSLLSVVSSGGVCWGADGAELLGSDLPVLGTANGISLYTGLHQPLTFTRKERVANQQNKCCTACTFDVLFVTLFSTFKSERDTSK